jgi:predicted enzyme related to lactoylglutathione lyase
MTSESIDSSQTAKYGQICWLQIPVTDSARAMAFYRHVLDWDCKDECLPGPLSHIKQINFFSKGSLNGAFATVEPEDLIKVARDSSTKQSVLASYTVASIEETLEKVQKAGGRAVV